MTKREIAGLSFKIVSVFALMQSLLSLSTAGFFLSGPLSEEIHSIPLRLLPAFAPFILLLGLSWFLWQCAGSLGKILFPSDSVEEMAVHTSATEMQGIAFSVLGVYVLYEGFSRLVYFSVTLFARARAQQTRALISPEQYGEVARFVVMVVMGSWLLLGAPRLVDVLQRIRGNGNGKGE